MMYLEIADEEHMVNEAVILLFSGRTSIFGFQTFPVLHSTCCHLMKILSK